MNKAWQAEFRARMDEFGATKATDRTPVSIKVRVEGGCFHREHSPQAYRLIDDYVAQVTQPDADYRIEEHETGPEILVYLAVATAGLTLAKSIIDLVIAIIKARPEGIKKGDRPSEPLELIVRCYNRDGEYFEERILRIRADQAVTTKLVEDAFRKLNSQAAQKKKRKRK